MVNLRKLLSLLSIVVAIAWAQDASAQGLGGIYDGYDPSAVVAVFEAYGDAQADLADDVAWLEAHGITVYSSSVDVIDVTHVAYVGGIWHMRLQVLFDIDTCGPTCEP